MFTPSLDTELACRSPSTDVAALSHFPPPPPGRRAAQIHGSLPIPPNLISGRPICQDVSTSRVPGTFAIASAIWWRPCHSSILIPCTSI